MNSIFNLVLRKLSQGIIDLIVFALSLFAAYFIRFEGVIPDEFIKQIAVLMPYIAIARSISIQSFSVYKIVWCYISIRDVGRILKGVIPVTALLIIARDFAPDRLAMLHIPISVITLEFMLVLLGTAGIRMITRLSLEASRRQNASRRRNGMAKRALLIGAGDAGNMVAKGEKTIAQIASEFSVHPKQIRLWRFTVRAELRAHPGT